MGTYVGGAENGGNDTTPTITHGLTINEGDIVVAYVNHNSDSGSIVDAGSNGWTNPVNEIPTSETARHSLWWKEAGASEPSSYSWTITSSQWKVLIKVFRPGTGNEYVIDAAAVSDITVADTTTLVCSAVNGETVADDSVSVVFGGKDNRYGGAEESYTTADNSYVSPIGTNHDQASGGAHRFFTTGTTINFDVTINTADGDNLSDVTYSVHISFKEQSTSGSSIPVIQAYYSRRRG